MGAIANISASDPVIVGTVSLTGMEVPSELTVGGQQKLVIHRLPGGEELIDVAGNDPDRLELHGYFVGPYAYARAQELEGIRKQGLPVTFSVAGLSWRVFVAAYQYTYQSKGAVIPYRLTLERQETARNKVPATTKEQSQSVGNDIGTALTSLAGAVGNISQTASDFTGQAQTVIGQVTPIANLVGAGSVVAKAQNALEQAQAVTTAGTDLGSAPAGLATLQDNLSAAGDSLTTAIQATGQNLENIQFDGSAASLLAMAQNAQIQSAAADAGALVNRANRNATTAGGGTQTDPLVHS
ncbi:hypothetical protein [Tanticharoenia sakaeratensis]|uniref:hypothetical protein n=1 Tax=Tanticharoenia sakaeratensis TaxID=444053 RepID=UPI0011DCFAF0|nr:hypothetical protein [Tanticharoenia sakaeratensis]